MTRLSSLKFNFIAWSLCFVVEVALTYWTFYFHARFPRNWYLDCFCLAVALAYGTAYFREAGKL